MLQEGNSIVKCRADNNADSIKITLEYIVDELEFINSSASSGIPEHHLLLKVRSIIMLLWNLKTQSGLFNRTRLTVKELHKNIIVAKTIAVKRINTKNKTGTIWY